MTPLDFPGLIPPQTEAGRAVEVYLAGRVRELLQTLRAMAERRGGRLAGVVAANAAEARSAGKAAVGVGLPSGFTFRGPLRGERRGGAIIRVGAGTTKIVDRGGAGTRLLGALGALEALRSEQEALRAARVEARRMWLAMSAGGLSYWDWDVRRDEVVYSTGIRGPDGSDPAAIRTAGAETRKLLHPDDVGISDKEMERIIRTGDDSYHTVVRQWPLKDGPQFYIESRGKVVDRDPGGHPTRLIGVFSIVNDRIETDREKGLRDEQLARALRLASAAEIVGRIAHELNQPLAALSTYSQAALRFLTHTNDLEEARVAIEKCVGLALKAARTVQAIRRSIRIEASANPVNLRQTVEEALDGIAPFAERHNVRVRFRAACPKCTVIGDEVQLGQLVTNLLSNAIEACPPSRESESGAIVDISLTKRGGEAVLAITNPVGVDVSSADLSRFFEPFVSTKPRGLGLGLSICRSIAEAHGGTLRMSRLQGNAICVQFVFPYEKNRARNLP